MKEKKSIASMFASIASTYDQVNSVLTMGMDKNWRKKLVRLSEIKPEGFVLDCATGTGKLAFEFLNNLNQKGRVIGVDFCQEMLDQVKNTTSQITFQKADILELPFEDNTFDVTSIAYGLRNLSNLRKGLSEMARVTKLNGHVMILETGKSNLLTAPFLNFYMKWVVPFLGGWISGNKEAYKYLHQSSLKFPSRKKLIQILKSTGYYKNIECYPLFFGASYIYKAQVVSN